MKDYFFSCLLRLDLVFKLFYIKDIDAICATIKDQNLRLTLAFGIGIHHAGIKTSCSLEYKNGMFHETGLI